MRATDTKFTTQTTVKAYKILTEAGKHVGLNFEIEEHKNIYTLPYLSVPKMEQQ